MEQLLSLFPELTEEQRRQFATLLPLYTEKNAAVNVISRKDIDNLYQNHVLHSLSIAKFITPEPATRFIDLGCGGGFPGIPLAILWPDCTFHLIDRIGKKVRVASEIAEAIGLKNCIFQHGDSGECRKKFDFVISRAVMSLPDLVKASLHLIDRQNRNRLPNGLICLKGGDLETEIKQTHRNVLDVPLSDYFPGIEYYSTKYLVYCPL